MKVFKKINPGDPNSDKLWRKNALKKTKKSEDMDEVEKLSEKFSE
jgi:hypothetical protein